ncbi:borealin-2-like [Varanus komodoensis]|uniref:borealin-2-like n=1 Tax=Varanus komodoensis TaxID=61221 RepID=UPI001CF7E34B|nr:borealin-2-like [Varanus komodoensis]
MALRKRLEEGSGDSGVEPDRSLLSKEQRDQRISLFLRDFDHQAKENLQDLKKELASLLQVAEKAFRVELLAMPTVVRKMRRKDLIDLKEEAVAATVLKANDCGVGDLPQAKLVRTNSKRVKVTTIVEYKDEKEGNKTQAKKASQKVFKANSLTSLASTTKGKQGPLSRPVSAFSTPNARTLGRSASMREQSVSTSKCPLAGSRKFAQRVPSKSASASGRIQATSVRSTSMPLERHVPFVNIPLADGQTLCSAGEDLQNINVELLNDDTVQHIHTLVNQLTVLCGKATVKSS